MSTEELAIGQTLTFEQFWRWFQRHPNCLLRAGTTDTVIYDFNDYHWYPGVESDGNVFVQMLRGKQLIAEIVVNPAEVAFVRAQAGDREGEFVFDLCDDTERVLYYFVLSHGYDDEEGVDVRHWN